MEEIDFFVEYKTAVEAFICLCGLLLHMAMKWGEYRSEVAKVGVGAFIAEFPAQTAIAVLGSVVAFVATLAMDWMNPGMAVACGYMGNSVAENIASKYANPKG